MTKAVDIETTLLGRAIMEPNMVIPDIYNLLEPKHFYDEFNQVLYSCLKFMFGKYHIDALTVTHTLAKRHEKKPLPLPYGTEIHYCIANILTPVTGLENPIQYSAIIRECYANRRMQTMAASFQDATFMSENLAQIKDELEELHRFELEKSDWKNMDEMIISLQDHAIEMAGRQKLHTGFSDLDNGMGIGPGDLVVIGARPSVGKTAFAGQIAANIAGNGIAVGFISLEMSNEQVAARMASIRTSIPYHDIWHELAQEKSKRDAFYNHISKSMASLPIFVSDSTKADIRQIKIKTAQLIKDKGARCIIIDYLQLVPVDEKKGQNREQEVAKLARACKLMAKDLKIAVILLAQLNRSGSTGKGSERYPQLFHLRESGAIEQDADIVLFLHRDYATGIMEDESGESTKNQADLICRKWRNGRLFHQKLKFEGPTMRFMEVGNQDYNATFNDARQEYKNGDNPF
jgi:replicative DNA helicase